MNRRQKAIDLIKLKSSGRFINLPMIVSMPILIGLIVLTAGIINKSIVQSHVIDRLPQDTQELISEPLRLMENLIYLSAVVASLAGLIIAIIIVRPIQRLSAAMAQLADQGETEIVDFSHNGAEIGDLGESFNRLMGLISSSLPERSRLLFHNMASGVIAFDGKGYITFINSAADKMLELQGIGVKNQKVKPFLERFGDMSEMIELLEQARLKGKDYSAFRVSVTTVSGRQIDLALTTTTLSDAHSGETETIATLMDLSRIDQIDKQIQHTDKLSSLGTLAAGVAHEIRNPLASLRGLTQLLKEDAEPGDSKYRYAEIIIEEVDRLNSVVQQLLDFSAVSKEEVRLCQLNDLIDRSIQLVQPALKKKGLLKLETTLEPTLPLSRVYERKLLQAFLNLLLNAIEAVNDNGTVRIVSRACGPRVEIDIHNSGSYIPPQDCDRIFDPFFTTKDKGTGLGLAITHQIVQQHGGAIRINSGRESGTCFTVCLPQDFQDEKAA